MCYWFSCILLLFNYVVNLRLVEINLKLANYRWRFKSKWFSLSEAKSRQKYKNMFLAHYSAAVDGISRDNRSFSTDCSPAQSFETASANSVKFRGIRPRMYIEDLL